MKIKYNILWIDDFVAEFEDDGHIDKIRAYLDDEGFEANVKTIADPKDGLNEVSDNYDLILTDWNMGEMNGDQFIREVRKKAIFTEILFYTAAKAELPQLDKVDRLSFLQTALEIKGSTTHHDVVAKEAIRLIGLTIAKFQDIVAMRGLIMHETSTLDAQIDRIIRKWLGCTDSPCLRCSCNDAKCKTIFSPIIQQMTTQFEEKLKLVQSENFKKIQNDNFVYSAHYKMMTLGLLLCARGQDDFSGGYKTDIINIRNKFAHAELKGKGEGRFFEHNELKFDAEFCRNIRKKIRHYKILIDKLDQQ